jgi:hypothetical protein
VASEGKVGRSVALRLQSTLWSSPKNTNWAWMLSVDGQGLRATGATARTAEVAGIAGGCLNHEVEASRSSDHGG